MAGAQVLILGAGGAAKAIAFATALAGAGRVTIANRTVDKAESLARAVQAQTKVTAEAARLTPGPGLAAALERADVVVQTTSVGMHPHHDVPPIVDPALLRPETLVCDIVYRPRETSLIKAAKALGRAVLTGEGMLAYQGAIALELWTGLAAPDELMLETLTRHLAAEGAAR